MAKYAIAATLAWALLAAFAAQSLNQPPRYRAAVPHQADGPVLAGSKPGVSPGIGA
jgi:hypothetical protein